MNGSNGVSDIRSSSDTSRFYFRPKSRYALIAALRRTILQKAAKEYSTHSMNCSEYFIVSSPPFFPVGGCYNKRPCSTELHRRLNNVIYKSMYDVLIVHIHGQKFPLCWLGFFNEFDNACIMASNIIKPPSKKKKPIAAMFQACYRLCVCASGSLITDIFRCFTLISVSCLHFGQNSGNRSSTVSSRTFNRVLLPQMGHSIQLSKFNNTTSILNCKYFFD